MKDYNYMALQGYDITDDEYAEQFGCPQEVVGTPEINNWMIDRVYSRDVKHYKEENGMTQTQAESKANDSRQKTRAEIKELLAQKGMLNE